MGDHSDHPPVDPAEFVAGLVLVALIAAVDAAVTAAVIALDLATLCVGAINVAIDLLELAEVGA